MSEDERAIRELVATWMAASKAGDSEGWRWASDGKGEFTIEPYPQATRGAAIVVHLREGEDEYLDPARLRRIINTYSDHIDLPIALKDVISSSKKATKKRRFL